MSSELLRLALSSLLLFIVLQVLLKRGASFYPGLAAAALCTALGYFAMSMLVQRFGSKI